MRTRSSKQCVTRLLVLKLALHDFSTTVMWQTFSLDDATAQVGPRSIADPRFSLSSRNGQRRQRRNLLLKIFFGFGAIGFKLRTGAPTQTFHSLLSDSRSPSLCSLRHKRLGEFEGLRSPLGEGKENVWSPVAIVCSSGVHFVRIFAPATTGSILFPLWNASSMDSLIRFLFLRSFF